ncbi:sodium-translocating pyrophosphatase [Gemmatimonadota bacterium]
MSMEIFFLIPVAGLLALLFAFFKARSVNKCDPGNEKIQEIGKAIREGAMAFLAREYKVLSLFVLIVALLLAFGYGMTDQPLQSLVAVSFVIGAFCSGLAGFFGMRVATAANMRTANAAREGLPEALNVAFGGGSVMGMSVVGLAVLGLSLLFILFKNTLGLALTEEKQLTDIVLPVLSGFSLGASSIALFARVGGGIYTKAADVGADLVGKIEAGIPEDDPRNPAVIADNVGDNVGDVAGMGADLFESYVGAIIGSMVLGATIHMTSNGSFHLDFVLLPLVLAAVGIVVSIIGTFFVRTREGGDPQTSLNIGIFGAAIGMAIVSYFIIRMLPEGKYIVGLGDNSYSTINIFWAMITGLVAGTAIGLITEYYTSESKGPARNIAAQSETGAATNLIAGLGTGMQSTAAPVAVLAIAVVLSHYFAGLYGIAIAAFGMLATTGIQLAVDAYGPIADNAGGITEMAGLGSEVRSRTDRLDAVGNTTAAIGKGFAIGSAALTALALFSAFRTVTDLKELNINDPLVMAGLFIGGLMPFLFSSFAMSAVGKAAFEMIEEVRRQFKDIPGLMEGKARADYAKCVDISAKAAIKRMIAPGLLAVLVPVVFGFISLKMLGGILAGVTVTGVLMAIFMANAGGAWDNAKKYIESGALGGKGSPAHKAAVVGDTVGDPFKDTAGPSINILIKLMSVISLVLGPLFKAVAG